MSSFTTLTPELIGQLFIRNYKTDFLSNKSKQAVALLGMSPTVHSSMIALGSDVDKKLDDVLETLDCKKKKKMKKSVYKSLKKQEYKATISSYESIDFNEIKLCLKKGEPQIIVSRNHY